LIFVHSSMHSYLNSFINELLGFKSKKSGCGGFLT
jgi:hypothetical protein